MINSPLQNCSDPVSFKLCPGSSRRLSGVLAFIFLVAAYFPAYSQQAFIDSLKNIVQTEKNDTTKVRLYVQIGNRSRLSDTTESWRCYREISKIAEQTDNEYFRGQAFFLAATIQLATQPVQAIS